MPSIIFPLEIEEKILDLLSEDDSDEDHSALKTCSLVCQAFLSICRKHIFGNIILNEDYVVTPPSTFAFQRLLRKTPEIADYIRRLDYNIRISDLTSPLIQESLKRISGLKFLAVRHHNWPIGPRLDWSNNPIRPALLHLLHLPTLTHLKLTDISRFITSDLIPCVNLQYLDIGLYTTVAAENSFPAVLPRHSIQLNEFKAGIGTAAAIMKLCKAQRPDGQPVIDFGALSKITVAFEKPNEGVASQELFRRCHALTNAHIYFWDPRNVRPSLSEMLRPSMQTLKHIVVNIHVSDDSDDPLSDITSELEVVRTISIIETITIGVSVRTNADCRRGADWGRLDEVLTTPGWFSLKRVSLAIKITFGWSDNELALRKLFENQLPRLSSSNSISFDFKINP